jgi:formylglycine-generating enzyme required for sulfatase activity
LLGNGPDDGGPIVDGAPDDPGDESPVDGGPIVDGAPDDPGDESPVDAGRSDSTGKPCSSDADCGGAPFGCAYSVVAGCGAAGVCERTAANPACSGVGSCACDGTTTSDCDLPPGFAHKPAALAGSCDGGAAPAPSCQIDAGGTARCGPSGESCCTSPAVAGGSFDRTFDPMTADGGFDTTPDGGPTGLADPATVDAFRLDKYEVTVGRFRQFVNYLVVGGSLPADGSGKHAHLNGGQGLVAITSPGTAAGYEQGWVASDDVNVFPLTPRPLSSPGLAAAIDATELSCGGLGTWTDAAAGHEVLPISCVDWYEAYAFCIWDGGFLPSAAEWEYAAAGGGEQREYPWGASAPGTANQYAIYGCNYSTGSACAVAPVGTASLGIGLWGQLDLAGNVSEWALDVPPPPSTPYPFLDPCTNCVEVGGDIALAGGGAFTSYASGHEGTGVNVTEGNSNIGFRCARAP